ncbi:BED zinc finger family protein, partial [Wuchereria bancrofti]
QQYAVAQHCVDKGKVIAYNSYSDEGGPSYAGEVFIREDGSYAEGDEFVDVVYVQDGNSFEEIISKSNDGSAFVNKNEEAAIPSRLKRSISDSELAQPSSRNGNNDLEHYDDTNLETDRSIGSLNLLSGGEKRRQDIDDEHFSRTITSSILTFPPEQRELVRCAVMQCIEELRSVESTTAEEAEVHEVTDEELVQISDV